MKRLKKKSNSNLLFDGESLVLPFAGKVGDMPEEKVDNQDADKTYGPDRIRIYPSQNRTFNDLVDGAEWVMRTSKSHRGENRND